MNFLKEKQNNLLQCGTYNESERGNPLTLKYFKSTATRRKQYTSVLVGKKTLANFTTL